MPLFREQYSSSGGNETDIEVLMSFVPADRESVHTGGDTCVEDVRVGYQKDNRAGPKKTDSAATGKGEPTPVPVTRNEQTEQFRKSEHHRDEPVWKANRMLRMLGLGNELIIRATNETALLRATCRTIVEVGRYPMAVVAYLDDEPRDTIRIVAWNGADKRVPHAMEICISDGKFASHPCSQAMHQGRASVINDVAATDISSLLPEIQAFGFRSLIALPLVAGTTRLGVLMIYANGSNEFTTQQQEELSRLANNLAFGIEMLRSRNEQQRTQEEIGYLAYHDGLTGLRNRHGLLQSLEFTLSQATRHDWSAAVLFMDLDRFKFVNDTLGHEAGDDLLRQVARRIQGAIRETDLVARQSGDEFIVLLTGQMTEGAGDGVMSREAAKVAQKIIESMKAPFQVGGREIGLSVSIGISVYPADAKDARTLLQRADHAMYWAREKTRGCYRFYSQELSQRQIRRSTMEHRLKNGLARNEFVLNYQPIVELHTGRMVGAEALIRWQSGDGHEPASPGEFIPVAEDIGLIRPLGAWIAEEACKHLRQWQSTISDFYLSLNLSSRQLWYQDVVEQLLEIVSSNGITTEAISLEITEDALMSEPERVQQSLQALHDRGFGVSLDDFARGYSSVSRLKRLPVDTLKIDRSFLQGVPENRDNSDIVTATVRLAHALGKHSLAEGVETPSQWHFLKQVGCKLGQGFYFSKPVPATDIQSILTHGGSWQSGG